MLYVLHAMMWSYGTYAGLVAFEISRGDGQTVRNEERALEHAPTEDSAW